jgi:formylglycine-generating enzyme required for sulfatase activity
VGLCPKCGRELPGDGGRLGECPHCLLSMAMTEEKTEDEIPGGDSPLNPETFPSATAFYPSGASPDLNVNIFPSGTRLGPYEIVESIGAGGMGRVYRARDTRLGRDVALKVLPREASQDRTLQLRFQREARAASALNHPNIVSVYDVGYEGSTFYIVTELVVGESLRSMIDRGSVPVHRVIAIGSQIAEGVAAAHAAGIVHRDLKPENVMLTRDGRAKVLDFGLAKHTRSLVKDAASLQSLRMTAPDTVMGTVGYMSPEQIRAQAVDHRSDIFSLGAILSEMMTGKPAFTGSSAFEILGVILFKEDASDLPLSGIERVIRRCLEKEPDRRFQNASDLAFALQQSVSTSALGATALPAAALPAAALPATALPAVKSRHPVMWWTGGALLLAIAAWVAFWHPLAPRRTPPAQVAQPVAVQATQGDVQSPAGKTSSAADGTQSKGIVRPKVPVVPAKEIVTPGATRINPVDGQRYVWIPPGTFQMGCSPGDTDCSSTERPAHQVTLSSGFWMGQTELTVGAYKRYANATGKQMPPEPRLQTKVLNPGWADERQPIVNVTWDQAKDYCGWAGMRLPTEAEWEWAARGGTTGARYGNLADIAWYSDNSGARPFDESSNSDFDTNSSPARDRLLANGNALKQVGLKKPNSYGLYDMLGNVWEPVEDWFGPYNGAAERSDPTGPASGQSHVLRGGAWGRSAKVTRVSSRANNGGSGSNSFVGFRCVGRLR